jgi:hypothetical protein
MRKFNSPDGRQWTATLLYIPSPPALFGLPRHVASTSVLQFCSSELTLHLLEWPDDWSKLPDEALVSLLRRATIPSYLPLRASEEILLSNERSRLAMRD